MICNFNFFISSFLPVSAMLLLFSLLSAHPSLSGHQTRQDQFTMDSGDSRENYLIQDLSIESEHGQETSMQIHHTLGTTCLNFCSLRGATEHWTPNQPDTMHHRTHSLRNNPCATTLYYICKLFILTLTVQFCSL